MQVAKTAGLNKGIELSREQVEDLLAVDRSPRALSEPIVGSDGDVGTFGDLLVDPLAEEEYERVLSAIEVEEPHGLLAGLSDRERQIVGARYGLEGRERSLRDVGEQLGISGERVRQIERRALGKLAPERLQALRKVATPEEVAAAVVWLASSAASHVTGETITVAGGMEGRLLR